MYIALNLQLSFYLTPVSIFELNYSVLLYSLSPIIKS